MGISLDTVRGHIRSVYRKLRVSSAKAASASVSKQESQASPVPSPSPSA